MTVPVLFPGPAGPSGAPVVGRGPYDPTIQYALGNAVQYEGATFLTVVPLPVAGVPPLNDSDQLHAGWQLLVPDAITAASSPLHYDPDTGALSVDLTSYPTRTETNAATSTAQATAIGAAAGLAIVFGS